MKTTGSQANPVSIETPGVGAPNESAPRKAADVSRNNAEISGPTNTPNSTRKRKRRAIKEAISCDVARYTQSVGAQILDRLRQLALNAENKNLETGSF